MIWVVPIAFALTGLFMWADPYLNAWADRYEDWADARDPLSSLHRAPVGAASVRQPRQTLPEGDA